MRVAFLLALSLALAACGEKEEAANPPPLNAGGPIEPVGPVPALSETATGPTVAETPSRAKAADKRTISWREHLIDDEALSGVRVRGADGLVMADLNGDGHEDIVSANEDSDHVRVAFGTGDPKRWVNVTIAEGAEADTVEDVAVGDINGDGDPDVVIAAERGHLLYLQNPGAGSREESWARLVVPGTSGGGSWIRVFLGDFDRDGRLEVVGANKGIIDAGDDAPPQSVALFRIAGDPLAEESWHRQTLLSVRVPINAMPFDIDGDGDLDVLAGSRGEERMVVLENVTTRGTGIAFTSHPIVIAQGFSPPLPGWQGESSAFNAAFADLDGDGRLDLALNLTERWQGGQAGGWAWLRQPERLDEPWLAYRIGDMMPDLATGLVLADIDGDGDHDLMSGSYSGFNILKGGFSGDPRDHDGPNVTSSSSVGRIAWYENPGDPAQAWTRHDVTRRVRGMFDSFAARDLDGDGDVDFVATRGNSGDNDGVFWLEQVRTAEPQRAFFPARTNDSADLPLPPADWIQHYNAGQQMEAPPS